MVAAKETSDLREEDLKFADTEFTGYRSSQVEIESPQWGQIKSPAETVTLLQASESAEEAGIPAKNWRKDHLCQ